MHNSDIGEDTDHDFDINIGDVEDNSDHLGDDFHSSNDDDDIMDNTDGVNDDSDAYIDDPGVEDQDTDENLGESTDNDSDVDIHDDFYDSDEDSDYDDVEVITENAQSTRNAQISNNNCTQPPPPSTERESQGTCCPICLGDVKDKEPVSTLCGHIFCKVCIVEAMRTQSEKNCPMCMKKLPKKRPFHRIFL
jgi:hypothetical protein